MKLLPKKTPGADLFAAVGSVDVSQGAQEERACAGRAEQPRRYTGLQPPAGNASSAPGSQTLRCCKLELHQIAEGRLLILMPLIYFFDALG